MFFQLFVLQILLIRFFRVQLFVVQIVLQMGLFACNFLDPGLFLHLVPALSLLVKVDIFFCKSRHLAAG